MKLKLAFRCVFTILLCVITILLMIICFTKATNTNISIVNIIDYKIENNSEECDATLELIYTESNTKYYLPCTMSNDIVLVWNDGSRDYLKDALNNQKVTIKSLKNHGLEIYEEQN